MSKLFSASMMCADYGRLKEEVEALDNAGIDSFHCDVMDGSFVPNMTMGLLDVKTIRMYTEKMVDVHLMIENPSEKVDWFIQCGVDLIYIHPESERYVIKTLARIQAAGIKAGIVINPDTSIQTVEEMLNLVDYVMIMSVNPGFAGQAYIDFVTTKIKKMIALKHLYNFKIMVDGACDPNKVKELSLLGVDGFVLGTSALFAQKDDYICSVAKLRTIVQ